MLDVNPLIYLSSFNESVIPMTTEEAMAQFEHYLGQCFLTWTFLANLEIEHTGMQWRIRTGPKICFYYKIHNFYPIITKFGENRQLISFLFWPSFVMIG